VECESILLVTVAFTQTTLLAVQCGLVFTYSVVLKWGLLCQQALVVHMWWEVDCVDVFFFFKGSAVPEVQVNQTSMAANQLSGLSYSCTSDPNQYGCQSVIWTKL